MIPLAYDFRNERVLVFGGGSVAARKASHFAREASVTVVSPAFVDADFGDADLVRERPDPADVRAWVQRVDPALVVTATDEAPVNDAAARAAASVGALVNRADGCRLGDTDAADDSAADAAGDEPPRRVNVPATVEDGPVSVAVDTGGTSPALAKYLREHLAEDLAGVGELAQLLGDLRVELGVEGEPSEEVRGLDGVDGDPTPDQRRAALRAVARSERVWTALDSPTTNTRDVALDVIASTIGDQA